MEKNQFPKDFSWAVKLPFRVKNMIYIKCTLKLCEIIFLQYFIKKLKVPSAGTEHFQKFKKILTKVQNSKNAAYIKIFKKYFSIYFCPVHPK